MPPAPPALGWPVEGTEEDALAAFLPAGFFLPSSAAGASSATVAPWLAARTEAQIAKLERVKVELVAPPFGLNLHYLITPYGPDELEIQRTLGEVMGVGAQQQAMVVVLAERRRTHSDHHRGRAVGRLRVAHLPWPRRPL